MPPTKVPKPKLRKGIKRRQKNTKALSANVHIMVWLDYLLNLTRLGKQAGDKAREEKTSIINPNHVKAVTKQLSTTSKKLQRNLAKWLDDDPEIHATVYKGCKG